MATTAPRSAAATVSWRKRRMAWENIVSVGCWIGDPTAPQPRDGTITSASPSITTVSPTRHTVFSITRALSRMISVTVTRASTLAPVRLDLVADAHRRAEAQVLRQVDRAGARQARGDGGGEKARRENAVDDAALEAGGAGIGLVEMDRVVVAGNIGEFDDVGFGDGVLVSFRHADREILEGVAGTVLLADANVVHSTLQSQGTCCAVRRRPAGIVRRKLTARGKPLQANARA